MSVKLDIAIAVPGMAMNWDTMERQSLGGSETAGLSMAKALAKQGHNVILFCNTTDTGKKADDVIYMPLDSFHSFVTTSPIDIVIGQRMPELFAVKMTSKLNILWCHDLAMLRNADKFKSVLWNVDKVMTVSQYMTDQYKEVYGLPDELFWTTRNGIDLAMIDRMFGDNPLMTRKSKQLVYASRPERGMDVLLESIMPKLWERDSEITLKVCGYDNTTPEMKPFHDYLHGLIAQSGGRVEWVGNLTKEQLYKLYAESTVYVYPTPSPRAKEFCEVSCITAMEAMACGLPFITSNRGALPETLDKDATIIVEGDPWTEDYQNAFVDAVMKVVSPSIINEDIEENRKNAFVASSMSQAGFEKAKTLGWDNLAKEWATTFALEIIKNNQNSSRLVNHLIRHSDIVAAKQMIKVGKVEDSVLKDYAFIDTSLAFEAHYEEMGKLTDERLRKIPWSEEHFNHSNEKRFALIEECLKEGQVESILDYGCGHGWCDIYLERRIGKQWTGVDVDPLAVKWSRFFADKFAKHPENMKFYTDEIFRLPLPVDEIKPYDCLIMSEVLEHCIDPVATVEAMEKHVKKDGMVLITVPYGPREYPEYKKIKYRNHIHEIDFHNLREMFGKKPGVEILCIYETTIEELGEPAGFYFIRYRADHKPLGQIDYERKLAIQKPRQTVSVSMIVGPNAEENLHWCLKSVESIADEIIIADCGMSEEAKRIALQYEVVKIVEGADPKEVGFDEARNMSLKHCTMDWVLWIDSDEKLIGVAKLHKYLRENIFSGYSIRQHHFACDTAFKPDMPVRLFRNRPNKEGVAMKFYGSCHEHPEYGLNAGPGPAIVLSDVHIAHVGYLIEEGRKKRFSRNYPLLQMSNAKYPDRLLNKYFTMRDNQLLCGYELQVNGNQITENIRLRCEDTINLYRTHFLGKGMYLNTDALDYYSQACTILGRGADINFCVSNGTGEPEMKRVRFANTEDLQAELDWKAKEVMDKYENKWY